MVDRAEQAVAELARVTRPGGHLLVSVMGLAGAVIHYAAVIADLEKHVRKTRLALVGHEPGIGELAARLIGSRHAIEFKKGAVCRIDVTAIPPSGPGELRWLVTPKILRMIRK